MNCCPFIKSQGLEVPLLCLTLGNSCHFVYPVALPADGSMLARGRTAVSPSFCSRIVAELQQPSVFKLLKDLFKFSVEFSLDIFLYREFVSSPRHSS